MVRLLEEKNNKNRSNHFYTLATSQTIIVTLHNSLKENKGEPPHLALVLRRQLSPMTDEELSTLRKCCGAECDLVVVSLLDGVDLRDYFNAQIEAKGVQGLKTLQR